MLTQAQVKDLFFYDPDSGLLVWSKRTARDDHTGMVAGYSEKGWIRIKINSRLYKRSTLVWLYTYGEYTIRLDHRDGNRSNDRIINLRKATPSQQQANRRASKLNKLGVKGVRYKAGKYEASVGGTYIGRFETLEEAQEAYRISAISRYGEYARCQ